MLAVPRVFVTMLLQEAEYQTVSGHRGYCTRRELSTTNEVFEVNPQDCKDRDGTDFHPGPESISGIDPGLTKVTSGAHSFFT